MQQRSTGSIILFALGVCLVCSLFVSASAVALKDRQEANKVIDRQKKVLDVAGLIEKNESLEDAEIEKRFKENIVAKLVDLKTGEYAEGDANLFDQRKARNDPAMSVRAEDNDAKVLRVPNVAMVYHKVNASKKVELLILPIEGKGLWSTLYGYLALETDLNTIRGITFYEHAETPGLGGEVDNPGWKKLWPKRKLYDDNGRLKIEVVKGQAGPVESDPHRIDGMAGATITSRGVTHLVRFWLSEQGFKSYLKKFKKTGA